MGGQEGRRAGKGGRWHRWARLRIGRMGRWGGGAGSRRGRHGIRRELQLDCVMLLYCPPAPAVVESGIALPEPRARLLLEK